MQKKTLQLNTYFSLVLFFTFLLILPFCSIKAKEKSIIFNDKEIDNILSNDKILATSNKEIKINLSPYVNQEGILLFQPGYHSEIENYHYCLLREKPLCEFLDLKIKKANLIKKENFYFNLGALQQFIKDHINELESLPQEPRLRMNTDGIFVTYKKGVAGEYIKVKESTEKIVNELKNNPSIKKIMLVVESVPPKISLDNLAQMGIKEKIGHGQSNFRNSPKNRIYNIKVATERFNGVILAPREKFSFVSQLGSVDKENGYKEELVIKNNETKPEFGGGICQVSTTLFRAVVNSGFEVVARKNHAYPVSYYAPQGTDATVYIPQPDLVFINNTDHYALIQPEFNGTILSFDIYGTDDGRKVELSGPVVTFRDKKAGTMKTSWSQTVTDKEGKVIIKKIFKSFYDNPDKYHKEKKLTKKPKNWSKNEWKKYKKQEL